MQLSWAKPGNPMEGGQKAGTNRREGREGGGEMEGGRGSRAKPGNQLVEYKCHIKLNNIIPTIMTIVHYERW